MGPKALTHDRAKLARNELEARLHAKDVGIALETAEAQQLRLPCLDPRTEIFVDHFRSHQRHHLTPTHPIFDCLKYGPWVGA